MEKVFEFLSISTGTAIQPTFFYVATEMNNGATKGFAFSTDESVATGYGFLSIDRSENTFAHELGHTLGLADSRVNPFVNTARFMHNHRKAYHFLMAEGASYTASPIDAGQRFAIHAEKWLFTPRSDRNGVNFSKNYIKIIK